MSGSLRTHIDPIACPAGETSHAPGSGVFDPDSKCLLSIMSRKFMADGGKRDIAKYFVPA
jgi:hypothetical protein